MLFSEMTCNSTHDLTLYMKEDKPWALRPLSTKTPFTLTGKVFVQNTFDSRHKEDFLTIEVVHEANSETVSLLLHKSRFKVETNYEFEGEATIYLLKPNEVTPEDCTTPPRKMSMTSTRSLNCDPKKPSISIYQNCFPIQSVLSALRENFSPSTTMAIPTKNPAPSIPATAQIPNLMTNGKVNSVRVRVKESVRGIGSSLGLYTDTPLPPEERSTIGSGKGRGVEIPHGNGNLHSHTHHQNHGGSSNGIGNGNGFGFYHPPLITGKPRGRLELKLLFKLEYKYTIYKKEGIIYKPLKSQMTPFALSFKTMLEEAILSDVQLEVENSVFPAHMAVLASQSEVFKAMFESNMLEKRTKRVIIHDMSAACVKEMLNFLYTRETTNFENNIDLAIEMLHAAEKYFIADLHDASIQALKAFSESNLHHLDHQKHLRNFLKSIVKF